MPCSAPTFHSLLNSTRSSIGVPFSGVTFTRPSTLPLVSERSSDVSLSGKVEMSPWMSVNDASKQLNISTMCVGGTRSWREGGAYSTMHPEERANFLRVIPFLPRA